MFAFLGAWRIYCHVSCNARITCAVFIDWLLHLVEKLQASPVLKERGASWAYDFTPPTAG